MLKFSIIGLLLIVSLHLPAMAESATRAEPAPPETKVTGMRVPVPGEARPVALAQRRDTMAELARAVTLTVFFRTGSMEVEGETLARIRLLGDLLRAYPELRVYLDAHSDRRGSNAHNRRLSRARADIVAGMLRNAGIPAHRIHGNAWGETLARATTDDAEGLIFDRRVDIQLSLDPEA